MTRFLDVTASLLCSPITQLDWKQYIFTLSFFARLVSTRSATLPKSHFINRRFLVESSIRLNFCDMLETQCTEQDEQSNGLRKNV